MADYTDGSSNGQSIYDNLIGYFRRPIVYATIVLSSVAPSYARDGLEAKIDTRSQSRSEQTTVVANPYLNLYRSRTGTFEIKYRPGNQEFLGAILGGLVGGALSHRGHGSHGHRGSNGGGNNSGVNGTPFHNGGTSNTPFIPGNGHR